MKLKSGIHYKNVNSEKRSINNIRSTSITDEKHCINEDTINVDMVNYNQIYFELSLDLLVLIGVDGKIININKAMEQATGLDKLNIIGREFEEYFTDPFKAKALYKDVLQNEKVINYELELKNVDGYSIIILYNASIYKNHEGKIVGLFASGRDITDIKHNKDELIYLKNNLELLIKQRAAKLIIANEELAYEVQEKADREDELFKANIELAFQNSEKEKRASELIIANKELAYQVQEKANREEELFKANIELAFQNSEKEKRASELIIANKELAYEVQEKANRQEELFKANVELAFQNSEKEKRASELVIANIELAFQSKEKGDRAAELIDTNRELMYQKEKINELNNDLELRVKDRTAQLESANIELESLTYSISHDLKAPLRHITGYVSLLEKKYLDLLPDDGKHYLGTISGAAKNMGVLIDGLLQFSRIGRIEINPRMVNMNELINLMIKPIIEQDLQQRIELSIDLIPSSYADIEMMKSVWSNLIENAVKFTQKEEIARISIGSEETKDEIIYFIKDNGAGFDMKYAKKLFTVFHRLHAGEDYEGTGIGLATVKRIITRHGGKIWAEAKPGEGASFYFTLNKRKGSV